MVKNDLYEILKKEFPHLKNETLKGALNAIFEEMVQGLVDRREIVIRGIGTFLTEERKMPKENFKTFTTGEKPDTFICVKYYPSRGLKERANKNV
jgi:nucleoid DNA-binding protein